MKKRTWKTYLFWIGLAVLVGVLSGLLTRNAQSSFSQRVQQLPATPPAIVFPVVWTVLYALMGIGAARVALTEPSPERSLGLLLFGVQLAVNFLWSPVFFNLQAFGFALVLLLALWILVLWMSLTFWETDKLAALLQIPYLLWLILAAYLAFGVWILNQQIA